MRFLPLFAAAALAFPAPALTAAKAPDAPQRVVLPADVAPTRYELRIIPDPERLSFRGHERIALTVKQPTDRIVLNAADLAFQAVRLSGPSVTSCAQNAPSVRFADSSPASGGASERSDPPPRSGGGGSAQSAETEGAFGRCNPKVVLDDGGQTAAFVFTSPLAPGAYQLDIDYTGRIYQQASGLFALDTEAGGRKVRDLFTQFENSDARRLAPLWDEPAIKAVFSLTVEAPAGQTAVSNMPVATTEPLAGGRTAVTFADTPKMSSYLLFLGLGDFERVHRQVGATDVGVIVNRGETAKAGFALDAASELLGYYNDWFGTPFPLPKLDFVAGPGQSQFFSAMENWGAIFAFDKDLLVDPASSPAERQRAYVVIAHEMAHQWFGDLVTMAWWDDLWLNEGFASWMENKATDHFHPEWKMPLQSMASRENAMRLDAGAGSHPVITPIPDVFAAADAFDAITYQKGEAVIRMLERYVGEDAWRAGIRAYIAHNAYSNTTTDALWTELQEVSPQPVTQTAHDFTLQPGLPLIQAAAARDGLKLTQARFATEQRQTGGTWLTPVRAAPVDGGRDWAGLVSRTRPQVAPIPASRPAVVNAGQSGYFRSLYAPELWASLAPRYGRLAPADQLGLLYDSRALGEAGFEPMDDFLLLARSATQAEEPVVLSSLADELAHLARSYPQGRGAAYRAYARARLAPVLARIGWDPRPGEADNLASLRGDLIADLGDLDDPAVIAEARRRFEAALAAPGGLTGALRNAVQAVVARHADPTTWEQLHRLARTAPSMTERNRLYRLLGAAKDPALADRALGLALGGEPPPTTSPAMISAVSFLHPDKAYDVALAHRAAVETLLEPTSRTIFFTTLARNSTDPAMIGKLDAFARTVPPSSRGEATKAQSEIRRRRLFIERRLPEVDRWLAAHRG